MMTLIMSEKKIAELKTAYNAAYSVAGNNRTADHSDDYERKEFKTEALRAGEVRSR